jgi:hypothetical protein
MAAEQLPLTDATISPLQSGTTPTIELAQTEYNALQSDLCSQPSFTSLCLSAADLCLTPITTMGPSMSATEDASAAASTPASDLDHITTIGVDQEDLRSLRADFCRGMHVHQSILDTRGTVICWPKGGICFGGENDGISSSTVPPDGATTSPIGVDPTGVSSPGSYITPEVPAPTASHNATDIPAAISTGMLNMDLRPALQTYIGTGKLPDVTIESAAGWPMGILALAAIGSALWYRRKYRQAIRESQGGSGN